MTKFRTKGRRKPVYKRASAASSREVGTVAKNFTVTLSRDFPPLRPDSVRATVRFYYNTLLDAGAGAAYAVTQIAMNSPYDPLFTVGGGVCTGFANWMNFYGHFFVHRCRIKQSLWQIQGSPAPSVSFLLPVRSDQAAAGITPTIDMVTECPDATSATQFAGQWIANGQEIERTWVPTRFDGVSKVSNKREYSGDASNDPVYQPVVYCGFISAGGALDYQAEQHLLVEYDTEFYAPLAISNA